MCVIQAGKQYKLTNNRIDWKDLHGANTLAHYEHSQITDVQSFITHGPGANVIELFMSVIYELLHKVSVC